MNYIQPTMPLTRAELYRQIKIATIHLNQLEDALKSNERSSTYHGNYKSRTGWKKR